MFSYKDLCGPDPKPLSLVEAEALRELCRTLPPNPIIIQIGADIGASTLAMLDARPDAFIFSIDCGAKEVEFENLKKAKLPWWRVVRGLGRSQQIGKAWPKTKEQQKGKSSPFAWTRAWECDLLYIDGDHRRPGIDDDIALWPDVVNRDGVLVLHDYILPEDRAPQIIGRVYEAVEAWREKQGQKWIQEAHIERLLAFRRHEWIAYA